MIRKKLNHLWFLYNDCTGTMSSSSVPTHAVGPKPPSKRPVTMFVKNTTYTPPPSTTSDVKDFKASAQTINPHLDPRNDNDGFKCVEHSRHHSQKSKVQDYSKDLSEESSHEEEDND